MAHPPVHLSHCKDDLTVLMKPYFLSSLENPVLTRAMIIRLSTLIKTKSMVSNQSSAF